MALSKQLIDFIVTSQKAGLDALERYDRDGTRPQLEPSPLYMPNVAGMGLCVRGSGCRRRTMRRGWRRWRSVGGSSCSIPTQRPRY